MSNHDTALLGGASRVLAGPSENILVLEAICACISSPTDDNHFSPVLDILIATSTWTPISLHADERNFGDAHFMFRD